MGRKRGRGRRAGSLGSPWWATTHCRSQGAGLLLPSWNFSSPGLQPWTEGRQTGCDLEGGHRLMGVMRATILAIFMGEPRG